MPHLGIPSPINLFTFRQKSWLRLHKNPSTYLDMLQYFYIVSLKIFGEITRRP